MTLSGVVDENADLSFFERLAGHARLNLKQIRRVNSYGVRSWIDAIRKVPPAVTFELLECPPSVVDQINMVAGFTGRGKVTSFYAPMTCEPCGAEKDQLFTVAEYQKAGKLAEVKCQTCGGAMEIDDLEEQYLLFARSGS